MKGKPKSTKNPGPYLTAMIFLLIIIALFFLDNVFHEPPEQPTAHMIVFFIDIYSDHISDPLSHIGTCRFVPTCSDYMRRAVFKYGSIKGTIKGIGRILRCHPATNAGRYDYP